MGARAERARLGLRLGARRGRAAPTGRAGLGAAGPAVRRPGPSGYGRPAAAVATSRSAGGGSLLPLAAGPGALFARPAARTRCEGARRGDDEWAGGARPGGSGTSGPAVKRAGTPPGSRPGSGLPAWRRAGEGGLGSALPGQHLGSLGEPSPHGRSQTVARVVSWLRGGLPKAGTVGTRPGCFTPGSASTSEQPGCRRENREDPARVGSSPQVLTVTVFA